MKKLFFNLLSLSLLAGLVLTSCEDEFTEEQALEQQRQILEALNNADNANDLAVAELNAENAIALSELNAQQQMAFQMYQDSLEKVGPVVNYSVSVLAAGTVNTNGRTSGEAFAPGATVTVVQGGVSRTETAGDNGVAIFGDLRIGTAIVSVSAPDHTSVTYTTTLGFPGSGLDEDNVETTIPLLPTTVAAGASQVSGTVYAQLDATTEDAEVVEGAIVRASLSVDDVLDNDFGLNFGSTSKGEITSATFSDFTKVDTTDANGMYTLVIPNALTDNGNGVSANIEFLPYDGTQDFYAEQGDTVALVTRTVRFDPSEYGTGGGTIDTNLPGVWAEVSSPEGNAPSGFELGSAVNPTNISTSTIRILNGGTGYAEDEVFTFATGVDTDGIATTDYAYVTVQNVDANGRILDISVSNNGALYTSSPGAPTPATAAEVTEIGGFAAEPQGTGASFEVLFVAFYDIFVANGGSGYSTFPDISVTVEKIRNQGGGSVIATDADNDIIDNGDNTGSGLGSLDDDMAIVGGVIVADDGNADTIRTFTGPFASPPTFVVKPIVQRTAVILPGGITVTDGEIDIVNFDDFGSGYGSAPTVTFNSATGMGSGAAIVVEIFNGQVSTWTITNGGSGYMDDVNERNTSPDNVFNPQSQDTNIRFKPGQNTPQYNFNYQYGAIIE